MIYVSSLSCHIHVVAKGIQNLIPEYRKIVSKNIYMVLDRLTILAEEHTGIIMLV